MTCPTATTTRRSPNTPDLHSPLREKNLALGHFHGHQRARRRDGAYLVKDAMDNGIAQKSLPALRNTALIFIFFQIVQWVFNYLRTHDHG